MLFTQLFAQDAAAPSSGFVGLVPILLLLPLFYFLIIRPNQQAAKKQRERIAALKKGDEVILAGGLIGKIVKLTDREMMLEVAPDVHINALRSSVSQLRSEYAQAMASPKGRGAG